MPEYVEGNDPETMHQLMASTLERCVKEIRFIQHNARTNNDSTRPRWPMIVLRSPKGWTCPPTVDGHHVENFWRAHQVPIANGKTDPKDLALLASDKTWLADILPIGSDATDISPSGRVMEMLSEHTLEGWFEGYVLTGRHGFFSTYESFVHIIDSMFNQHSKWLEKAKNELRWRAPISSVNLLITSLVWRQDHNGFTHQDPGFLDAVANKSPDVVRIYLPPHPNCLLSVTDYCLRSVDCYNVIVSDKQPHLVFLSMEEAVLHCTKASASGIGPQRTIAASPTSSLPARATSPPWKRSQQSPS